MEKINWVLADFCIWLLLHNKGQDLDPVILCHFEPVFENKSGEIILKTICCILGARSFSQLLLLPNPRKYDPNMLIRDNVILMGHLATKLSSHPLNDIFCWSTKCQVEFIYRRLFHFHPRWYRTSSAWMSRRTTSAGWSTRNTESGFASITSKGTAGNLKDLFEPGNEPHGLHRTSPLKKPLS